MLWKKKRQSKVWRTEVRVAILNSLITEAIKIWASWRQQDLRLEEKKEGSEPCGYLGKEHHRLREHKINLHWELTRGQREMKVRWWGTFRSDAPTWNALWRSHKLRKKDEKPGSVKNWQVGWAGGCFSRMLWLSDLSKSWPPLGVGDILRLYRETEP